MRRRKIVLAAMMVLVGGICAAWPFRKVETATNRSSVETEPAQPPFTQRDSLATEESPAPGPLLAPAAGNGPSPDPSAASSAPREANGDPQSAPPGATGARPSPALAGAVISTPPNDASPRQTATLPHPRPATWRRHRIKDGDSLERLAQTFLGDPGQAATIFSFNRDILADPEILPIGRWLRIPPEGFAADQGSANPQANGRRE